MVLHQRVHDGVGGGATRQDGQHVIEARQVEVADHRVLRLLDQEVAEGQLVADDLELALGQAEFVDQVLAAGAVGAEENLAGTLLDDRAGNRAVHHVGGRLRSGYDDAVLLADDLQLVLHEVREVGVRQGLPELVDEDRDALAGDQVFDPAHEVHHDRVADFRIVEEGRDVEAHEIGIEGDGVFGIVEDPTEPFVAEPAVQTVADVFCAAAKPQQLAQGRDGAASARHIGQARDGHLDPPDVLGREGRALAAQHGFDQFDHEGLAVRIKLDRHERRAAGRAT